MPCALSAYPPGKGAPPQARGAGEQWWGGKSPSVTRGCLVQEAFQSRRDMGPCLGLAQPGGEQDEVGFGLMLLSTVCSQSLWTVWSLLHGHSHAFQSHCTVSQAPHYTSCLAEGVWWATQPAQGASRALSQGASLSQRTQTLGAEWEVTGAAPHRGCCQASGWLPALRMFLLLFCRYP